MKKSISLKVFVFSQLLLGCFFSSFASAKSDNFSRPDAHAPIGVMRDHVHKKGEYMLSYRYELMSMKGARSGGDNVSSKEVLKKYMMAPRKMDMKMHMFGAMYGITDKLTVMTMGSFVEKDMQMVNRMDQKINREASDFGDVKLNSMYQFFNNSKSEAQFNLGVSIPTGSIKQEYNGVRLPYAMQIGSGSYELLPGVSYKAYQNSYSYGAQVNAIFRLDDNNSGYRFGDSLNLTAWTAKKLNEAFSISSRLNYTVTQKVSGEDDSLNKMMSPPNNVGSTGGRRMDFLLGANFIAPSGFFKNNRLAIEGGMPIYQNLNGTQLKTDYTVSLGWQRSF
jgi:hypothetical protein